MKRKIIIGFDPQHGSRDVLRFGRLLAEVLAARPIILTALPWPNYMAPPADLQAQVDAEMRSRFLLIEEDLRDFEVETRAVAHRSPAEALHEIADAERAQMIVLGPCHRGPIGRTLAGSVGESLMHGAPCAIAVAPQGYADREQHRLLQVAVAFDGSPEAWSALEMAIGLAERCHGTLTVLTVADCLRYGTDFTWPALTAPDIEGAERIESERLLESALAHASDDLPREGRLLIGSAGSSLAEASNGFDLMITGSRAYGPALRTLLGSATRQLIRSSSCPVLVLPRGAAADPLGMQGSVVSGAHAFDDVTA